MSQPVWKSLPTKPARLYPKKYHDTTLTKARLRKDAERLDRDAIHLADLHRTPLVLREQGSMTRQMLEDEMRRLDLDTHPAIEVEGREAVFEMVVAGLGVGIVSAAELGSSRGVHVLPIQLVHRRREQDEPRGLHLRGKLLCQLDRRQPLV